MSDVEKVKQQLRDLGIPVDGWNQGTGGTIKAPIIERQKELLIKARDLLQQQVDNDVKTVGELHEKVKRLKHGGGF